MQWSPKPLPDNDKIKHLQLEIGVPQEIASLLLQRGIDDYESAKSFFRPELSDLHDPFLMLDMREAVYRIIEAIQKEEKIMVYGDYDVDGTTAVALVYSFLMKIYPQCIYYIPDRFEEGYGISTKGIDHAKGENIGLIIAMDCGIKAVDKVNYAKTLGIDFIICDHHLPGEVLPKAVAILDPKQPECSYPFKELCGCGIGFKLIQALNQEQKGTLENLLPFIDLVAIAIAADIVPIVRENRVLTYFGIQQIQENPRLGIRFFISKLKRKINVSDLVFVIAPRINGAGRINHGIHAVALLLSENQEVALSRGRAIELFNSERKELDQKITAQALDQIKLNEEEYSYSSVVFQPDWHKGVLGIVASRLIENYYRPTIVFAVSGDHFTGSARSVKGVDIYQILETCKEHIVQFGGHRYAAGLTINPEDYLTFKRAFELAVEQTVLPEQRIPSISYDLEITLDKISPKFHRIMAQMAPFGPGNMCPVFLTKDCLDEGRTKAVGDDQRHLKLEVRDESKSTLSGIGFGMANHISKIKNMELFDILYTVDENEFRGEKSLQLKLKDLKF
ncbi:MAG: single-stranded-DNA-specific exonuclease RecJ [Flavobacteriaceae bacterium TMED179]|nr:MAG: single-stranded-DNA-specific exonuclease RecJ [Flavobacteriaceae bacterium TMED179]|tara:strand:- start:25972 stop:27660 length:1689 start_codon:yes stop_codon:yes gene_type:complete